MAEDAKSNAKIKEADVELKANEICFYLKGTLVDECGVFGQNFVDVDFDGCTTVRLEGVQDGEVRFRITEELGIGDADKTDVAKCVLLSFLDLQILKIAFEVFKALITKMIGFVVDLIVGSSDISGIGNLFEPNIPIPETELLPRVTVLSASVDSVSLTVRANLELVEDDLNTYIYVLFNQISAFPPFLPRPVQDATVELLDQDAPRPAGDDVRIPVEKREIFVGDKILKIVTTEYEPPAVDELLGSDTTDFRGRARFMLKPNEVRTTMGTLVVTTSLENIQSGQLQQTSEVRTVLEGAPDIYFRLTVPGGKKVDSRKIEGGFLVNLRTKRLGSGEGPIVLTFPSSGPVVAPVRF